MKMHGWRAWYAGGSVYSSLDTDWKDLPAYGVQIVAVYYEEEYKPGFPYRKLVSGKDWYWLEDGDVHGVLSVEWGVDEPPPEGVSDEMLKKGSGVSYEHFIHLSDIAWSKARL